MFENEKAPSWFRPEVLSAKEAFAAAGLSDDEATDVLHRALLDVLHRAPARPEILFRQLIERGIAASLERRDSDIPTPEDDSQGSTGSSES